MKKKLKKFSVETKSSIPSISLKKKIQSKKITIGVVGLGYVGIPLAILFAKKNFKVFGFDINKDKIQKLKTKKSYLKNISNKDIETIFKKGDCFSDFEKIRECDIIVICVPTPLKYKNKPDLSYVKNSIKFIKNYLHQNQLIILESTSYPGTTREEVVEKINDRFNIGKDFFIGFSSERINPGFNENSIQSVPKVVSGYSKNCLDLVSLFYKIFFNKVVHSKTLEIAEFSKLLENIYRAVNIGFINEMKFIADKMDIDIFDVIKVARTKTFGFRPFDPGPGIGGHCIPVDPHYLYWKSMKNGTKANFIKLSAETNEKVIKFIHYKIFFILKKLKKIPQNAKVLILGIAYKKNIDDCRESSSLKLIDGLLKKKFKVSNIKWCDPYIKTLKEGIMLNQYPDKIKLTSSQVKNFDIIILMTDHDIVDYDFVYKHSKMIIDCRGRFPLDHKVIRA
jgi:UDP-N-acetyl-D-glucosamine dehydrogenase